MFFDQLLYAVCLSHVVYSDQLLVLGSFTKQDTLGRKLPKVTLVDKVVPAIKESMECIPHVAFHGMQSQLT